MKLVKVSYEQDRLEFFEKQFASAKRKLDWAVKHNPDCYAIALKADEYNFYEWAVEMAKKEAQNMANKTCAVCGCPYVGASCPICGSRDVEEE